MKETKAHGLWYMICVSVHIANASWTTSTNLLIHSDDQMSIGVHNDTIWLIGGRDFPTQLTQYKVRTQTMTNFGDNALTASIKGYGQYWTQQNHMVYIIDQSTGNSLCTYNMITNQFQTNWKSITFNTNVGDDGCLASDAQYLYVTGGEDGNALGLKTLQMLSLSTHQWTTSPPNMNVGRKYHACIVHNTYLWAMGGTGCTYNCPNALTSIERIVVTDIMNNKWNIVSNLPVPLYSLRVIDWYDTLYVLGGYSLINNMMGKVDSVYLIDVDSGDVSVSPHLLPSIRAWVSPIIHDSVLYVFGGTSRAWAYYQLPQPASLPTDTPTEKPSNLPTNTPSNIPSNLPSNSPSNLPSNTPSNIPSNLPSNSPSNLPSNTPSNIPSNLPTDPPNKVSTLSPSNMPTVTLSGDTIIAHATPTARPSNNPVNPVYVTIEETEDKDKKDIKTNASASPLLLIISVALGVTILVIISAICCYYKKKITAVKTQAHMIDIAQMDVQSTQGNVANDFEKGVTTGGIVNQITQRGNQIKSKGVATGGYKEEITAQTLLDWLTHVVGLPQYHAVFIEYGFSSFRFVKRIENEEQIRDMGIDNEDHVSLILSEIRHLCNQRRGQEGLRPRGSNEDGDLEGHSAGDGNVMNHNDQITQTGAHGMTDIGSVVTRNVSKCIDCLQVKEGREYEEDGQFYCHLCWSSYVNDVEGVDMVYTNEGPRDIPLRTEAGDETHGQV
eukprot:645336_1